MECSIEVSDFLVVRNAKNEHQTLNLDTSRFYCSLFETTHAQCRDYLDEIMHWADGNVENYEYVSENLFHYTIARRKLLGFAQ